MSDVHFGTSYRGSSTHSCSVTGVSLDPSPNVTVTVRQTRSLFRIRINSSVTTEEVPLLGRRSVYRLLEYFDLEGCLGV